MQKASRDIDVRKVLMQIEAKQDLKLPWAVITIDYYKDIGDLNILFKMTPFTEGEQSDGKAIIYTTKRQNIS